VQDPTPTGTELASTILAKKEEEEGELASTMWNEAKAVMVNPNALPHCCYYFYFIICRADGYSVPFVDESAQSITSGGAGKEVEAWTAREA
jgi:hypothetical protein